MLLAQLITKILSHVHPCRCNEKADLFSYGVLLWEMITQEPPRRGHLRDLKVRSCTKHTMCPAQLSYLQTVAAARIMQYGLCSLEQVSMATIFLSAVWNHARLRSLSAGLLLLSYSKDEALQAA